MAVACVRCLVYLFLCSHTAWPRELKRRLYGNRVNTIVWSRFNSHPYRTRCCILGWLSLLGGAFRWLSLLGGFEQAAN